MSLPSDPNAMSNLARVQPHGTHPMSWAVDLVLALQEEGHPISPQVQCLLPLSAVIIWSQQLHQLPAWEEIGERWGVHRATVYRWLPALRRARKAVGKA